jgi:hypothetical protein
MRTGPGCGLWPYPGYGWCYARNVMHGRRSPGKRSAPGALKAKRLGVGFIARWMCGGHEPCAATPVGTSGAQRCSCPPVVDVSGTLKRWFA